LEQPCFFSRVVLERRLQILSDALQLNYLRALQWSFAQAVLSAIWDVEDGKRVAANHPGLTLARTIDAMLS
jgi:streptomycin 6-kinase